MIHLILMVGLLAGNPPIQCEDARSTVELRNCLREQVDQLDIQLKARVGEVENRFSGRSLVMFARSQRAWSLFRDIQCESEALQYEGGSLAGIAGLECHLRLSQTRFADLLRVYLGGRGPG